MQFQVIVVLKDPQTNKHTHKHTQTTDRTDYNTMHRSLARSVMNRVPVPEVIKKFKAFSLNNSRLIQGLSSS